MTTKAERTNALAMIRQGYSYDSVAGFFQVKADTVRGWNDPTFAESQTKRFKSRSFKRKRGWS